MAPLVSVVMPVHNAEGTLRECLDSVVAQTFPDFELICIDDGSTDRSGEILDAYARQHDFVRVIHQKNVGQYPSRNVGIDEVRGRYMMSIDCDDVVDPNIVERALIRAEATGADITIVGWDYLVSPYLAPDVMTWNMAGWSEPHRVRGFPLKYGYVWMKMYRMDFLRRHQLRFREEFYSKSDVIFHWVSMSLAREVTVLPEVLYHYRVHENSITGTIGKRFIQVIEVMEAIKEELRRIGDPQGLLRSWHFFALSFIHGAYEQIDVSHRSEMEVAVREFLGRLDAAELESLRAPGAIGTDTRNFYLSLASTSARFRYRTLYRWRKAITGALGKAFVPEALRKRLVSTLRSKVHSFSAPVKKQRDLRLTVEELNRTLTELATKQFEESCDESAEPGSSGLRPRTIASNDRGR